MLKFARAAPRFLEPHLHARLISRTVLTGLVIDHEEVTRTFSRGPGRIELVCIYEVREGKIQTAAFVFGPPMLESRSHGE